VTAEALAKMCGINVIIIIILNRAVEMGFKNLGFLTINLKKQKVQILDFSFQSN